MSEGQESALIVELPDVEFAVAEFRLTHDPVALRGIPAHVTLLYPFRDPETFSEDLFDKVEQVVARHEAFETRFTSVEHFPNAVWLAPEPNESFRRVTQNLVNVFPDCPPYAGKHGDYIPHMTVAQSPDGLDVESLSAEFKGVIDKQLPLSARARAVSLYVSQPEGDWQRIRVFLFGDATGNH